MKILHSDRWMSVPKELSFKQTIIALNTYPALRNHNGEQRGDEYRLRGNVTWKAKYVPEKKTY